MVRAFGYGIVDKDGDPWWEEACVSAGREGLDEEVGNLNGDPEDGRCPYRVVRLYFAEIGGHNG